MDCQTPLYTYTTYCSSKRPRIRDFLVGKTQQSCCCCRIRAAALGSLINQSNSTPNFSRGTNTQLIIVMRHCICSTGQYNTIQKKTVLCPWTQESIISLLNPGELPQVSRMLVPGTVTSRVDVGAGSAAARMFTLNWSPGLKPSGTYECTEKVATRSSVSCASVTFTSVEKVKDLQERQL